MVSSGQLILNGSILGNTHVYPNAVLSGIGTMAGNLLFDAGGVYSVTLDGTSSTELNVSGSATLTGGQVVVSSASTNVDTTHEYPILRAQSGFQGVFSGASYPQALLYIPSLRYDASQVYLSFSPLFIAPAIYSQTVGVDQALNAMISSGLDVTGELLAIIQELGAQRYNPLISNEILLTLVPVLDGGNVVQSFQIARQVFGLAGNRMLHHRGSQSSGVSSGDFLDNLLGDLGHGVWLKAFGEHARQSERDNIAGYKDSMWGLMAGRDFTYADKALGGFAFSWANLNVHSDVSNGNTKAENVQLTTYGEYDFDNPWYANGFLAVGYNTYKTNRHIVAGNQFLTPQGKYHGWQFSTQGEIGYDLAWCDLHVTPLLSGFYSYLSLNSYTEQGAGTAGLTVDRQHYDTLLGGLGLRLAYDYVYGCQSFEPEVHIVGYYDFINEGVNSVAAFVGSGPSFATNGLKMTPSLLNLGASVTAYQNENGIALSAHFDYEVGEQYNETSGFLRARYEWA